MHPDGFLRFGLIGWPIDHSLSPRIHKAAMDYLDLEGDYRLYPLPLEPEQSLKLEGLIFQLKYDELDGLNITIPYKVSVCSLIDGLSPRAMTIGAVNTLYRQDGRVIGENTDALGFLTALQLAFPNLFIGNQENRSDFQRQALVLGGGGAARAVVYVLLKEGWCVAVAERSLVGVEKMIAQFEPLTTAEQLLAFPLDPVALTDYLAATEPDLIVNATSVGMAPQEADSPWPNGLPLPGGACVYDLVYKPVETVFSKQAKKAGLAVETGLSMLVEQAACSFELWTGLAAPRKVMLAASLTGDGNDLKISDRG